MIIDSLDFRWNNHALTGETSEQKYYEKLHKEYDGGSHSITDIAYKYGLSPTTVAEKFRQFGFEVCKRGFPEGAERAKAANGRFKKEVCCGVKLLRKIYKVYQDNPETTVIDLAYQYGIKVPTLYRLFAKHGFKLDYSRKKKASHQINRSVDDWSPKEKNILLNMIDDKESTAMFVAEFNRSQKAVQKKIIDLGFMYRLVPITKESRECLVDASC